MNKKSFQFSKTNHSQNPKSTNNQSVAQEVIFRHTYKSEHLRLQKTLTQKFANGFSGWHWCTV
jgi:hypothetical protein